MVRYPTGYDALAINDNILFTGDSRTSLRIYVSGAALLDKWRWQFYRPGDLLVLDCYAQIVPPAAPGNGSGVTALVQNCGGVFVGAIPIPAGCPCAFSGEMGFVIAGSAAATWQGEWAATIAYTNPANVTTPAIVQEDLFLVKTPLIMLLHGFNSSCKGVETLGENLYKELRIDADRVKCYDYDFGAGVEAAAERLGERLRDFVTEIDPSHSEVDIVAHSMGGLVARYYHQINFNGSQDPAIGSIAMLGTPNDGAKIAEMERWLCPRWARAHFLINKVCAIIDLASGLAEIDLHSQAIDDHKPGSDVLDDLNDGFALPVNTIYRAHIGIKNTEFGELTVGQQGERLLHQPRQHVR